MFSGGVSPFPPPFFSFAKFFVAATFRFLRSIHTASGRWQELAAEDVFPASAKLFLDTDVIGKGDYPRCDGTEYEGAEPDQN